MGEPKLTAGAILKRLARGINAHLKRFEADPKLNPDSKGEKGGGLKPYYNAGASYEKGRFIQVVYVSYQGSRSLDRDQATRYLAWLDSGKVGKFWEMEQEKDKAK